MEKKRKPRRGDEPPKLKDLDIEQRKQAILKQKQCDVIALNIIKRMIDFPIEQDVFLQSLQYLNQCHFQDIVEERALGKLCGYPVCGNSVSDMPAKKYHISTKSNKIYDITQRKNYCSNFCYQAAVHIKDQMLTSPLWFRHNERIPDFQLLTNVEICVPGEEIDQGIIKANPTTEEDTFTSISDFTVDALGHVPSDVAVDVPVADTVQPNYEYNEFYHNRYHEASLAEILRDTLRHCSTEPQPEAPINAQVPKGILKDAGAKPRKSVSFSDCNQTKYIESDNGIVGHVVQLPVAHEHKQKDADTEKQSKNLSNGLESRDTKAPPMSDKVTARDPNVSQTDNATKSQNNQANSIKRNRLKNSAAYKKAILQGKEQANETQPYNPPISQRVSEWLTPQTLELLSGKRGSSGDRDRINKLKYESICKKLTLMELADERFDSKVTGKELKPAPGYDALKAQVAELELRVQAFYAGEHDSEDDAEAEECEMPAVLPLLDNADKVGVRRKVFLTALSRVIPKVCEVFKMPPHSLLSDLKSLVCTMHFTAQNVVFRSAEWPAVAIVLLKLLSIRDDSLKTVFQCQQVRQYIQLSAEQLAADNHQFHVFLDNLTDLKYLSDICRNSNDVTINN